MAVPPIWNTRPHDEAAAATLAKELNVSAVTARLLAIRGLADLERAADRLMSAIASKERIAIHGDYDVDGITSTVILRRALELLGANVTHFIPERLKDGYGLQPASIERLHADGVRLVI